MLIQSEASAMPKPTVPVISTSLTSDPELVRGAIAHLLKGLDPLDLLQEEASIFELVVAEVINNVIEHAYANKPGGKIDILASPGPRGINCRITDQGAEMPDGKPPVGLLHNLDCDTADLPEGGFGWFLIGDLAKDLRYTRRDDCNHLSFRMAIGGF